ncbi:hypothetical protein BJ170DRAFT_592058 [Xylariales sp. AK1849]|nr:hypothetical protein BJ170DRAFT_592058 [Xylariales sp. AK1849]
MPPSYTPRFKLWFPEENLTKAPTTEPPTLPQAMANQHHASFMPCDWHGDSPEPELDDFADAHVLKPAVKPHEVCDRQGDVVEPELDDLAYGHVSKPAPVLKVPEPTPQRLSIVMLPPEPELPEDVESSSPAVPILQTLPMSKVSGLEGLPKFPDVLRNTRQPKQEVEHIAEPIPPIAKLGSPPIPVPPVPEPEIPNAPVEGQRPEVPVKPCRKKAREDRHRKRKEKKKVRKELKVRRKAERKAKEKEKRERKKAEKRKKKAQKSKMKKGLPLTPPPLPPGAEISAAAEPQVAADEAMTQEQAVTEVKKRLSAAWDGLPSINALADGLRKMIPHKHDDKAANPEGLSAGPDPDHTEPISAPDDELCPQHQLLEDMERLGQHLGEHVEEHLQTDSASKLPHRVMRTQSLEEIAEKDERNKHECSDHCKLECRGFDGASDASSDHPSKPSTTFRSTAGVGHTVSAALSNEGVIQGTSKAPPSQSNSSIQADGQLHAPDCGHPSNVARGKSQTGDSRHGEAQAAQKNSPPPAPGSLKRASCLCGAALQKPSHYAEYDTPPFRSPTFDTPSGEGAKSVESYFWGVDW